MKLNANNIYRAVKKRNEWSIDLNDKNYKRDSRQMNMKAIFIEKKKAKQVNRKLINLKIIIMINESTMQNRCELNNDFIKHRKQNRKPMKSRGSALKNKNIKYRLFKRDFVRAIALYHRKESNQFLNVKMVENDYNRNQ